MIDLKKLQPVMDTLGKGGVFLTSGKKPNTMVVSWGSLGVYFKETVFIAPVRVSRHTRELIDNSGCFSLSVPTEKHKKGMQICGSKSGRDTDKYKEGELETVKCKNINTHTIKGCSLTVECEVIAEMELDIDSVTDQIQKDIYGDDDYHIMYYGKIVNVY